MSILFLAILNRKKNFYTVKKILTGSGACHRRHKMRKPLFQMTSFWLSYLAIAIDNLYIHELLGYMRCLFFKAVTESFIFFLFFFFFFFFVWLVFTLSQHFCTVSIVYQTIWSCIILIMTLKLGEKSFENFPFLSLSSVQVLHTTQTRRRENSELLWHVAMYFYK